MGRWSSTGTNLEGNEIPGKLRTLLVNLAVAYEEEPDHESINLLVFVWLRFYSDIEVYDDGSCRISLDASDFFPEEDEPFGESPCRIDGGNLHVLGPFYEEDPWATLNLRIDGTRLVLWCDLEYYVHTLLELDPMEAGSEAELDIILTIKAIFVGVDRYENTFERASG